MPPKDKILSIRMPERLHENFLELANEKRATAAELVRTEIRRMLSGRIPFPERPDPSKISSGVLEYNSQQHKKDPPLLIRTLFQGRSNEDAWYYIAVILAAEVKRLEKIHNKILDAMSDGGVEIDD